MIKKILITAMMVVTMVMAGYAIDLNGKWKTSMASQDGSMDIVFTFKVDGNTLTGTVAAPMGGEDMQIKNGKINGNEFSFDVDMMGNLMPHKCKIEGDVIKMKVEFGDMGGGMPNEFILKKVQ
jgi:hypothetical protein